MKHIKDHEGKKYLITIHSSIHPGQSLEVDLYDILESVDLRCAALQHCAKKILFGGRRGKGDRLADLLGADAALSRAIDLERKRIRLREESQKDLPEESPPIEIKIHEVSDD